MFEYLMPSLWMRSYSNTLISRTQAACVGVHRDFARNLGIPWGISESGAAQKDDAGHYHYHAYGMPQIALWFEATRTGDLTLFDVPGVGRGLPLKALHNLHRMENAWGG